MKILFYGDSPAAHTGLGIVGRELLKRLPYDITIFGVNHHGGYNGPFEIIPAFDNLGRDQLGIEDFKRLIISEEYDLLFTHMDFQVINKFVDTVLEVRRYRPLKWFVYAPLDASVIDPNVLRCAALANVIATYADFSREIIERNIKKLKGHVHVINLGCDTEVFRPLPNREELRLEHFGIDDDTLLVMNCNANQWRKDLGRTMLGFKLFKMSHPRAKLYLHSPQKHIVGGDLLSQATYLGLVPGADILFTPPSFNPFRGCDDSLLNEYYNCADMVISTSMGEGWGLTTTEAMATKTPVVMPRNSSLTEIVGTGEERGYLAECGTTSSEWTIPYGFQNIPRPLTNVDSLIAKMHEAANPDPAKVEAAYRWVGERSWDRTAGEWRRLIEE